MKYAIKDATVYLKKDSQAELEPAKVYELVRGQEFEDDHELVAERPELFSDTMEEQA